MKIFISHSSKDKELVLMFVNLLIQGFHIDNNEIFCTSMDNALRVEESLIIFIRTVYGDVTYTRHVYRTTDEDEHRGFVYLLDETVKMDEMLEHIQTYADSVDTDDEKDTQAKKQGNCTSI